MRLVKMQLPCLVVEGDIEKAIEEWSLACKHLSITNWNYIETIIKRQAKSMLNWLLDNGYEEDTMKLNISGIYDIDIIVRT